MEDSNKELVELNSHQLGLITLSDLKDPLEDLSEDERREYVANASIAYSFIKKEIDNAVAKQAEFIARFAPSWESTLIGRGGINMGDLLLNRFKALKDEHTENSQPKEEFNPHDVV